MTGILTPVAKIESVRIGPRHVSALLSDGREVAIPLSWSKRLTSASESQRANYSIEAFGTSIHWPDVDEDIGLETFLGVSEDAIYAALGWDQPTNTPREELSG
jgi:Protein of unknown function (DUF2442)